MAILALRNRFIFSDKSKEVRISQYLSADLICFLNATTRDEAINCLIERASAQQYVANIQEFTEAVLQREKLVSTGIGMGVAVPHAKLPRFADFFIAIGIQQNKGIDWEAQHPAISNLKMSFREAVDQTHVRLIFLIGGPQDRQAEYLQILKQLMNAIRDQELRREIMLENQPEQIFQLFSKY